MKTLQQTFTLEEWTIVLGLLEREANDLPVELHHSRVAHVREELRHRAELIQGLLDRFSASIEV